MTPCRVDTCVGPGCPYYHRVPPVRPSPLMVAKIFAAGPFKPASSSFESAPEKAKVLATFECHFCHKPAEALHLACAHDFCATCLADAKVRKGQCPECNRPPQVVDSALDVVAAALPALNLNDIQNLVGEDILQNEFKTRSLLALQRRAQKMMVENGKLPVPNSAMAVPRTVSSSAAGPSPELKPSFAHSTDSAGSSPTPELSQRSSDTSQDDSFVVASALSEPVAAAPKPQAAHSKSKSKPVPAAQETKRAAFKPITAPPDKPSGSIPPLIATATTTMAKAAATTTTTTKAATSAAPAVEKTQRYWACPACTYSNPELYLVCEMCMCQQPAGSLA